MKIFRHIAPAFVLFPISLWSAPAVDVISPVRRVTTLELASKLLNPPASTDAASGAVNPFTLNGSRAEDAAADENQATANRAAIMASNRTLLAALSEQLEPKGTFVLGGESIILLGQKKLKVGERYPITFEGAVYELEITAIETTRFSVRYKNEEITRPIVITKSGK
ncbi:hypothetical protein [Nibricoccus aquaticus]|nr:hypothetical protein [Nibricoccus aquaticus]